MNRTGLLIVLAIAGLVGVVFAIWPELDLRLAALFYDPATSSFPASYDPTLRRLRSVAMWIVGAVAAPAFIAVALKLALPRTRLLLPGRAVLFLIATLALAPGLLVNVTLKDYGGRPRPAGVTQLGGPEVFVPWWDPRGACDKNCSFVGGEPSGAFWTMAPAALAPATWRAAAYGAAIAFGVGVSVLRMAFGGHFFTDVVFAGVLTYLVVWLMHGLIYRWRATRLSNDGVERALQGISERTYTVIGAPIRFALGRLGGRGTTMRSRNERETS
jgi:membrane-associated PAP2 superfamily phosphatase